MFNKKIWIKLIITEIFILIFGLFIIPAIWSVYMNKNPELIKYADGRYNPNTDEIVISAENNTLTYKLMLKHELCHQSQHQRGDNRSLFWREIECYIRQWGL